MALLATSPALCPPMPSATSHSPASGNSSTASSLCVRTFPRELTAADRQVKATVGVTAARLAVLMCAPCGQLQQAPGAALRTPARTLHRTAAENATPDRS